MLNFLKPRTLIPSKQCIVVFANREKKCISAKYYRNKEGGHLVAGYHSQEMSASQCSKKADIQRLHELIPNFSLFISTALLNSLLKRLHMIPVICIIILPLNGRPEKKSGPEILEIRKSCLSGHGN